MYINLRNNQYQTNVRDFSLRIRWIQEQLILENNRLITQFWQNKILELNEKYKDQAQFWREFKKIQGSKGGQEAPYLIDREDNNKRCYSDEEKHRLYNKTWKNVFRITPEENAKFDANHEIIINSFIQNNLYRTKPYELANTRRLNPNSYLTKPITSQQIKNIIHHFKRRAPGKSGINKDILENLPMEAIDRLAVIYNLALSMGYFTVLYKNGILILTNKPGKDNKYLLNHRPITLLEVPGKIFEKIINDQLMIYLEENNILHPDQYGFRKNKGTETALLRIYEQIAINQRYKYNCNIVCRDVSKAFDKVWHNGLCYKILQLELPDIIEKVLCSFLTDRTVQIRYKNNIDEGFQILSGVPQGNILSPTLYILYTADISRAGPGCCDVLFADDVTQIIVDVNPSKRYLARKTEREINRINKYEETWKIQTNKNKFQLLSVSKVKPHSVIIENNIIPHTNKVQVLGLTIGQTGVV